MSNEKNTFSFRCSTCGEVHEGMPTFGWDYPVHYLDVPEDERQERVALGADDCVIDGKWFFVRGCIEMPVHGMEDTFVWGVWVSLSRESFEKYKAYYRNEESTDAGPFFGWLCTGIAMYPDTQMLKTKVHLRGEELRPYIELEPSDHPLSVEQRQGISVDRVKEIYERVVHPERLN